jgi:ribosomal protein S18 acetylase RimI-like enzyme
METKNIIDHIARGMEYYIETLAIPQHMEQYDDGICAWIKPKAGEHGAACVYKVNFVGKSDNEIVSLVNAYREKGAPRAWFTTPLSTPQHIQNLLTDIGLMDTSQNPDLNDQGMAIPPEKMIRKSLVCANGISVKRVDQYEDFKAWCDIANRVLHGFDLLNPEFYYPVCESGKMICFLGCIDQIPVATSAVMNHSGNGTLEFIATLPEYRKKGMGTLVCQAAINQLIDDGAFIISLRARSVGVSLYASLGFQVYY